MCDFQAGSVFPYMEVYWGTIPDDVRYWGRPKLIDLKGQLVLLSLEHYQSAYVLLAAGFTLALIGLILSLSIGILKNEHNSNVNVLLVTVAGVLVSFLAGSVIYMVYHYAPVYNYTLEKDCFIIDGHVKTGPGCDYNG